MCMKVDDEEDGGDDIRYSVAENGTDKLARFTRAYTRTHTNIHTDRVLSERFDGLA